MKIKLRETLAPLRTKLCLHAALDESSPHGRRIGLQLLQLSCIFWRQDIGDGCHQLRDFHQRAFEPTQSARQRDRIAAGEIASRDPLHGDAGRNATHIGPNARITRRTGRKAIGFVVSHRSLAQRIKGSRYVRDKRQDQFRQALRP